MDSAVMDQQINTPDRPAPPKRITESLPPRIIRRQACAIAVNGGGCSGFQHIEFSISDVRVMPMMW